MSASIVSGRGGGPSAIGVTVAQPDRLRISRRALSPPAINLLVPLAALGLNDGVPVLVPVLAPVLQPPKHKGGQGAEDGKGTGDHFPSPICGRIGR
jgi:hypothetical protein